MVEGSEVNEDFNLEEFLDKADTALKPVQVIEDEGNEPEDDSGNPTVQEICSEPNC